MMHPLRRTRLLVPICLLGGAAWLSGCRPPAAPPARHTMSQAGTSPAGISQEGMSEVTVQQDGVPVTSLTYDSRVFFDSDRDRPRPEAAPVLDALARRPGHPPGGHVMVVRGLAARGTAPATLDPVGVGRRQPVADDASAAGRARNRRVEF